MTTTEDGMNQPFDELRHHASVGDEGAWSELFHTFAPAALGFLRAKGAPDPEDQLSETFLQAARDFATFHGNEQQFRNWLFTIARNRAVDAARARQRRPGTHAVPPDDDRPVASGEPTAEVDESVLGEMEVARLLHRLTPLERDVVALRFISDLDVASVAQIVGKRPNTVVVLTRRALAKLTPHVHR